MIRKPWPGGEKDDVSLCREIAVNAAAKLVSAGAAIVLIGDLADTGEYCCDRRSRPKSDIAVAGDDAAPTRTGNSDNSTLE
jgi:hypothetical protein